MRILPIDTTGSDLMGIAPQQAGQLAATHFNMSIGEEGASPQQPPLPNLLSDVMPDASVDLVLSDNLQPTDAPTEKPLEDPAQALLGVYDLLPENMDNLLAQLSYVPVNAESSQPSDTPQVTLWQAPLGPVTEDPTAPQDAAASAPQPVRMSTVNTLLPASEAPVNTPLVLTSQPKPALEAAEFPPQGMQRTGHEGQSAPVTKVTQAVSLTSTVSSSPHLLKQPQVALMTSSQTSIVNAVVPSEGMTSVWQSVNNEAHWKSESLGNQAMQWGQKLLTMLSDKVQLQVGQQLQRAHIRLDPPQLGSIDISISMDQERTTIHLSAQHGQIRDALSQQLEQLRQTLMAKLGQEVQVQVDIHHQKQQQQAFSEQPQAIAGQWSDGSDDAQPGQTKRTDGWLNTLA